jgi:hypothetical protein
MTLGGWKAPSHQIGSRLPISVGGNESAPALNNAAAKPSF